MSHEPFTEGQLQEIEEMLQHQYSARQIADVLEMSHGELLHRLIKSKRRIASHLFLVAFDPDIEEVYRKEV